MPVGLTSGAQSKVISHVPAKAEFSLHTHVGNLSFAIMAQYGGLSEPGTDICATQIAGEQLSLHTVVSCRPVWEDERGENRLVPRPLHNHPDGIALAEKCETVLSIRGRYACHDKIGEVCVDGLDEALVLSLGRALDYYGFKVRAGQPRSRAQHPDNICNRGTKGCGVELDISQDLMVRLLENPGLMTTFASAVRTGLHTAKALS